MFALAIGGVAVAGSRGQFTSSPTYSSRLRAERRAKLGAPEAATTTKLSLSTGCSPLNKLPFDTDSDFTGRVAAKIVTKGMSNDFLFEKGQDMKEVSCGNYEVDTSIALNEEFGFYLFPVGNETDLNTVLDSGCSHEGDARCPSFASPSALAGLTQCTRMYEDPGSGDKFYNRVFDGEQTSFTWGSCDTTCAVAHPKACPAPVKEDGPHQYWRYRLLEKEYAWNVKEIQFFQTQSSTTRRNRLLQRRAKSEVMAVVLNASNLVNGAVTVATDLSTTTCILGGRIGHLATRHNHGSVSI